LDRRSSQILEFGLPGLDSFALRLSKCFHRRLVRLRSVSAINRDAEILLQRGNSVSGVGTIEAIDWATVVTQRCEAGLKLRDQRCCVLPGRTASAARRQSGATTIPTVPVVTATCTRTPLNCRGDVVRRVGDHSTYAFPTMEKA
jgi:hypothetical protein